MEAIQTNDDASHYEISLTAGQAFIAFVLLLFSLAAAFAFGIIVGKGQFEDATAMVTPAQEPKQGKITELSKDQSKENSVTTPAGVPTPVIIEEPPAPMVSAADAAAILPQPSKPPELVPYFAQILSTADAKAAEDLAARLIDGGFPTAYVERSNSPRGVIHRVRVNFASETDARKSVEKLKKFSIGEIWIARQ